MRSCNNIYSAIINLYASIKSSRCDAHAYFVAWATPGFSGATPSGPRSYNI
ncbi:MAG: hypothetical protein WBZ29_07830 [Methanocella sp.]